jgi:aldose 1-epimerase
LIQLTGGDVTLTVDPECGGRWTSLLIGDLELLGRGDAEGVPPEVLSGCFPMAPFAGRVKEGRLDFRGTTSWLPITAPPHAVHGTVYDVPWEVVESGPAHVELSVNVCSPWPFRGRVVQRLSLHEDRLSAALVLTAAEDMPVTLGFHPWFPRRLSRGGAVTVEIAGGQQYERGPDHLPTGRLIAPTSGPWDDCFVGVDAPPRLTWPGALELELTSSRGTWVLFTELPDAVCVEPQTGPPDAVRLGLADLVAAGHRLALQITLAWRRLT